MILAVATALALAPCVLPAGQRTVSIGLAAYGHEFGGLGVVAFESEGFTLLVLSPGGTELFSVRQDGAGTTIHAAVAGWEPWLAQVPFERDLRLLSVSESCGVDGGRVRVGVEGCRRWRGRGGPARARQAPDGRWVLVDPRRQYRLSYKEAV